MIILLFITLFCLILGSFLNVVIYRLPLMLKANWQYECSQYLALETKSPPEKFNLAWPRSHCPACKKMLNPWQLIPLFGYLLQKGHCKSCHQKIPITYPIVELLTVLLGWFCYFIFPITHVIPAFIFCVTLLVLAFIDLKHTLLPDILTIPLLWLGLLINSFGFFSSLMFAVYGAVLGYLSLWLLHHLFKIIRKKQGMGYGDFKLVAAMGAWLGLDSLLFILLFASVLGLITGLILILLKKHQLEKPLPFGPYLAISGIIALLFKTQILYAFNFLLFGHTG